MCDWCSATCCCNHGSNAWNLAELGFARRVKGCDYLELARNCGVYVQRADHLHGASRVARCSPSRASCWHISSVLTLRGLHFARSHEWNLLAVLSLSPTTIVTSEACEA